MASYEIISSQPGQVAICSGIITTYVDGTWLQIKFTNDDGYFENQEYRLPTINDNEINSSLTDILNQFNSTTIFIPSDETL